MVKPICLISFCLFLSQFAIAQGNGNYKDKSILRIMSYNIRNGKGMDLKTDYSRVADVITRHKPDIIAIQEVDSVTRRNNGVYVMGELSDLAGMYATYGSAIPYDGGKYGVGILSKEIPIRTKNVALPGREEERTVLIAEFDACIFFCTHWSLTSEDRLASVSIVNNLASQYSKPVFMAGDFNTTPDSEEFKLLFKNWKVLNNIKKYTFPSDNPDRCIDYILAYSKDGMIHKILKNKVLGDILASDHLPLLVDVEF